MEKAENSKDGNRNEEKYRKYQRFRHWMKLQEEADDEFWLDFSVRTLNKSSLLEASSLLPTCSQMGFINSELKQIICCQAAFASSMGDLGIKNKVNTFIQPSSPFSWAIAQQLYKQNPTSHWFHYFLPSPCNSYSQATGEQKYSTPSE